VQQSSSKFRNLPLQAKDRRWANCAVALGVSGASRQRLCPDGPRVHLIRPCLHVYSSFMRPEAILPLDRRVLCSVCCKKCRLLCLDQVVFSHFVGLLQGWRTRGPQKNFVRPAKHSGETSSYYFLLLFVSVDEQFLSFLTGFRVWLKSCAARLLSGNWQSGRR